MDSLRSITRSRPSNWWESIINFVILRLRYRVNGAHTELSYWPIWKMLNSKNCENRLIMKDQNGRHHTPERQKTENWGRRDVSHTDNLLPLALYSVLRGAWWYLSLVVWSDPSLLTGVGHNCEGGEGGVSPPHSERRAQRCPGWDKTSVIWLSSKLVVTGITPLVLQHRWDFILFWRDRAVFQLMKW